MAAVRKSIFAVLGLIVFLFVHPFQLIHNLWCRHVLHEPVSISSNIISQVYATVLTTVEEALQAFMPDAEEIQDDIKTLTEEQVVRIEARAKVHLDPKHDRKFHFFLGKKDGEITGYAAEDVVPGKWGPIHYMLVITPGGKVKDVMVLEYHEKRGRPVAKRRFLKQFRGKTIKNKIQLMRDIRGVTGASISSRGMTNGIRKMLHVFNEFYGME